VPGVAVAIEAGTPARPRRRDLRLERGRPVGHRYPALVLHAREVHAVQPLVSLATEAQAGADPDVEAAKRFEGLAEPLPGRIGARAAQPFGDHLGVDEAFQADEAVWLRQVARLAKRFRNRRMVTVHR